jgi:hypothetical protein
MNEMPTMLNWRTPEILVNPAPRQNVKVLMREGRNREFIFSWNDGDDMVHLKTRYNDLGPRRPRQAITSPTYTMVSDGWWKFTNGETHRISAQDARRLWDYLCSVGFAPGASKEPLPC